MFNSPGLVDFPVGLVDFTLYLPYGEVKVLADVFFKEINLIHRSCQNFFKLVKITSGLVHPDYSLAKGLAGKWNFFVP